MFFFKSQLMNIGFTYGFKIWLLGTYKKLLLQNYIVKRTILCCNIDIFTENLSLIYTYYRETYVMRNLFKSLLCFILEMSVGKVSSVQTNSFCNVFLLSVWLPGESYKNWVFLFRYNFYDILWFFLNP